MASNIWLISTIEGSATSYYLSRTGIGSYTGSGTPWTAQSTTPYEIAMNDIVGRWTPQAPPSQGLYSGGPPFINGEHLVYRSYGNVTENVPIQMYASSHDNAVALMRQLRQILKAALYSVPCVLAVQPDGSTNIVYYNIHDGDVQEDERFINDEERHNLIRARMTITRSFTGGRLSSGETLISGATYANTGTGGTDNLAAYSAGAGELIYEGQPLNLDITCTTASSSIASLYLASVYSRTYDASGAGTGSTSSTISGALVGSTSGTSLDAALSRQVHLRVLGRFSNIDVNARVYIEVNLAGSGRIYLSPVIAGNAATALLDFGYVDLSLYRDIPSLTSLQIDTGVRVLSSNGSSASATLSYLEFLLYYTFCTLEHNSGLAAQGATLLRVGQFTVVTNRPCLPLQRPIAHGISTSTGRPRIGVAPIRGTPPQYFNGASLYAGWNRTSSSGITGPNDHRTTDQMTVTATHAPLWRTLRGGG